MICEVAGGDRFNLSQHMQAKISAREGPGQEAWPHNSGIVDLDDDDLAYTSHAELFRASDINKDTQEAALRGLREAFSTTVDYFKELQRLHTGEAGPLGRW